jgi:hypothetical protein
VAAGATGELAATRPEPTGTLAMLAPTDAVAKKVSTDGLVVVAAELSIPLGTGDTSTVASAATSRTVAMTVSCMNSRRATVSETALGPEMLNCSNKAERESTVEYSVLSI